MKRTIAAVLVAIMTILCIGGGYSESDALNDGIEAEEIILDQLPEPEQESEEDMTTGDKLVNLDDLKVAYDKQQEDTNALKSAINGELTNIFPGNGTIQSEWWQGAWNFNTDPPTKLNSSSTRISNHIQLNAKEKVTITGNSSFEYIYKVYFNGTLKTSTTVWSSAEKSFNYWNGTYDIYIIVRRVGQANIVPSDIYGSGIYVLADNSTFSAEDTYARFSLKKDTKKVRDDIITEERTYNLFDVFGETIDAYYNSEGTYIEDSGYCLWTEYVDITGISTLYSNRAPIIIFFDSAKDFISRSTGAPYTVPSSAKYMRIYMRKNTNTYANRHSIVITSDSNHADVFKPYYERVLNSSVRESVRFYNTVSDMTSDIYLTNGYAYVMGYYSPNDSGSGLYLVDDAVNAYNLTPIQLSNGHTAVLQIGDEVYPEQFGAYGDDTHDDQAAIQSAIDTGKTVKLKRNYYIASSLIIQTPYQKIVGEGPEYSLAGGRIKTDVSSSSLTNGALVNIKSTGVCISNLGVIYSGGGVGRTGLFFNRDMPGDKERQEFDMDCSVTGCHFRGLNTAVRYIGRGLRLSDCLFGSVATAIHLSLPAIYDSDGDGYPLVNPFGGRGIQIINNRSHNETQKSAFVYVTGTSTETYLGMLVQGNIVDHRGNLFYSEAMQRELNISGNTVTINTYGANKKDAICIKYADGCVVSNNTISAVRTQADVDAEMAAAGIEYDETITHTPPDYGMSLGEGGYIKNSIICGNVIKGFTDGAIKNGTIANSIIKDNIYPVKMFYDNSSVGSECVVSDNLAQT